MIELYSQSCYFLIFQSLKNKKMRTFNTAYSILLTNSTEQDFQFLLSLYTKGTAPEMKGAFTKIAMLKIADANNGT